MERLKQMSLKRALFTIALFHITIALLLSLLALWGCIVLRTRLAPQGVSIELSSGPLIIREQKNPTARADFIAAILSAAQMVLPVFISMIALLSTASMFYRVKIKEPLAALTQGASRIIGNDLDFRIEAVSGDELGQLCIAFETMRKTLLANNRELWRQAEERKRLNAAFSHNLRNPVTVLKGSVKLAKNSIAGGTATIPGLTGHLDLMENYTNRIERYVETMSSIQKLEEIPVEPKNIDWKALTSELEQMVRFVGLDSEKEITFTPCACEQCACENQVRIDRSIFFQIAENLLSNALRFAAHRIRISCSIADRQLLLSITDDGCGFPAGLLENGIQPFQTGKEEAGHFGMGLYTCQVLCKKHGGSITIQNTPEGAAVFARLEHV